MEHLIKDLISYSSDVNIPVQNNAFKKRFFDLAVLTIDYHRPIQLPTSIELIFFWLNSLSLLISSLTNSNHTKNESHNDNGNMGRKGNEVS